MPRTRIKICGIREPEMALVAAEAGADAIGLVFVDGSPRRITLDQARPIIDALPAFVEPVALFVDAPLAEVRETCRILGIRTIQLQGGETHEYVAALAPLRVTRSIGFRAAGGAAALAAWRQTRGVAAVQCDAPPPSEIGPAASRGGSGKALDWESLAALKASGQLAGLPPLILAGGLTPANVGRAIALLRPYAVDVSSGVESSRGVKDVKLIRAFCQAVRAADRSD